MLDESRFVHCHKCERGGNGTAKDKCACGWQVTKPGNGGCYLGETIDTEKKQRTV